MKKIKYKLLFILPLLQQIKKKSKIALLFIHEIMADTPI